ncbi:MAG: hypothetical protein ACSLFR_13305 [Solirubrobacteraceae bacterium]
MGRRARNRTDSEPRARAPRPKATDALTPARKVIAAYLGAAGIIGVLTLLAIATIAGTFGPILVFLVVLVVTVAVQRAVAARIAGVELSDDDRVMRMLATGVLITAVVLALISAVVSLLAA